MFSEDEKTWSEAREACQAITGYDLVSIASADLATFLRTESKSRGGDHWIGLNDMEEEGTFEWANGMSMEFALGEEPWNSGEPNVRYFFIQIGYFDRH